MARSAKATNRWLSGQARALMEATGLTDPEAAMRKLVADLLEEADQRNAPVNLPLVASYRGIVDIRAESINGPAMLLPTPHGFEILVNVADPPGRQNFSAAHEICHTFFPGGTMGTGSADWFVGHFSIGAEEEYLCDIGASSLLLPPHLISEKISAYGCTLEGVVNMAADFESSIEAAAVAWAQAASWPCAVVFLEEKLKPSQFNKKNQTVFPGMDDVLPQPELRIAHACAAPGFPFFLPRDKSVGRDGPICRCLAEEKTAGFDMLDLHGEENKIFAESVFVPYRKDGDLTRRVVSLIWPADYYRQTRSASSKQLESTTWGVNATEAVENEDAHGTVTTECILPYQNRLDALNPSDNRNRE